MIIGVKSLLDFSPACPKGFDDVHVDAFYTTIDAPQLDLSSQTPPPTEGEGGASGAENGPDGGVWANWAEGDFDFDAIYAPTSGCPDPDDVATRDSLLAGGLYAEVDTADEFEQAIQQANNNQTQSPFLICITTLSNITLDEPITINKSTNIYGQIGRGRLYGVDNFGPNTLITINFGAVVEMSHLYITDGIRTPPSDLVNGGGSIVNNGKLSIFDSYLYGNGAFLTGGAILNSGSLYVARTTFKENGVANDTLEEGSSGGAVHNDWGGVLIAHCDIFENNRAYTAGAAILNGFHNQSSILHIWRSAFWENTLGHPHYFNAYGDILNGQIEDEEGNPGPFAAGSNIHLSSSVFAGQLVDIIDPSITGIYGDPNCAPHNPPRFRLQAGDTVYVSCKSGVVMGHYPYEDVDYGEGINLRDSNWGFDARVPPNTKLVVTNPGPIPHDIGGNTYQFMEVEVSGGQSIKEYPSNSPVVKTLTGYVLTMDGNDLYTFDPDCPEGYNATDSSKNGHELDPVSAPSISVQTILSQNPASIESRFLIDILGEKLLRLTRIQTLITENCGIQGWNEKFLLFPPEDKFPEYPDGLTQEQMWGHDNRSFTYLNTCGMAIIRMEMYLAQNLYNDAIIQYATEGNRRIPPWILKNLLLQENQLMPAGETYTDVTNNVFVFGPAQISNVHVETLLQQGSDTGFNLNDELGLELGESYDVLGDIVPLLDGYCSSPGTGTCNEDGIDSVEMDRAIEAAAVSLYYYRKQAFSADTFLILYECTGADSCLNPEYEWPNLSETQKANMANAWNTQETIYVIRIEMSVAMYNAGQGTVGYAFENTLLHDESDLTWQTVNGYISEGITPDNQAQVRAYVCDVIYGMPALNQVCNYQSPVITNN